MFLQPLARSLNGAWYWMVHGSRRRKVRGAERQAKVKSKRKSGGVVRNRGRCLNNDSLVMVKWRRRLENIVNISINKSAVWVLKAEMQLMCGS